MQNRLKGKTVLITGASSGIGEACAKIFASNECNLILTARRVERLEQLKESLDTEEASSKIFVVGMDVTHAKQVEMVLTNLPDEFSKIDILVNNAGLALGFNNLIDDDPSNWERMIETNLKGFLTVLHLISQRMVRRGSGGHIVNIGSIAGVESYAKGSVYCATKHAVHAITQSLRDEMLEHRIRVSEILPGAVNTGFSQVRFHGDKDRADKFYQGFETLYAEDIAEIIAYTANLPSHVNLAESLILPTSQSRATKIHRSV